MAISDILNRRVKALPEEEEEFSEISGSDNPENASNSESGSGSSGEEDEDGPEEESEEAVSFYGICCLPLNYVLGNNVANFFFSFLNLNSQKRAMKTKMSSRP